ncbi:MAG: right-handed parallel beta-helix repeat-containing protein [Kofleriaceae bacterium]
MDRVIGGQPFEIRGQRGDHVGTFTYEGDRPARWLAEPEVWLHGYWFWDWSDSREQVASIDPDRHVIELKPPYHQYGYRSGQWFYAYGLLAELDQPGEWYIDRSHGTLVFWPPHRGGETIVSVASELLVLHDVSHVTFRGLTLEAARGSAILIDGGHDDEIERCVIRNVGGWGVRVSGGSAHGVDRSEITGTGLGGISLQGGDRTTLEPGGHHAIGNHIHHYSRWARTVQPAIEISGVGLHVADNYIHDAPHQAIAFSGNDHVIERNVIERVCEETNDAGAIYGGRDWTARGTTIRDNVFRDIRGLEGRGAIGVYLDDMLSGTIVEGNRFERVTRAVFIGGGRDNVVEHNTFLQCTFGIHIDARGLGWAAASLPEQMEPRLRAMPITSPTWRAHYPALASILDENPAAPRGNVVTHNVSKDGGWDEIEPAARALAVITENEVEGAR